MDKRGIVIAPPLIVGGAGLGVSSSFDQLELRKYLTYWDEIDYPKNNLIEITPPDIQFLETTDSMKRTEIKFSNGSFGGELFVKAQEFAFNSNNKKEPGVWSLAQQSGVP